MAWVVIVSAEKQLHFSNHYQYLLKRILTGEPIMSLVQLGNALKIINNKNGYNPDEACQAISVRVAKVLMGSAAPGAWSAADNVASPPQDGAPIYTGTNAMVLLNQLQQNVPMGTVLRAENECHAWNYIKDYHASIHVIDASCWNFFTVRNTGEFIQYLRNDVGDPPVRFNYGNGSAFGGNKWHQDTLNVYQWGSLQIRWSQYLHPPLAR